jgi:hypothetical protein
MRKLILPAIASIAFVCAAHGYPTLPYLDSFNGSGPSNPTPDIHVDDNGVTFWTTIPSSLTTPEQAAEAGGQANLASATEFGATVVGTSLSSSFNFFDRPLTFGLSGLTIGGTTTSAADQQFVYAVQDDSGTRYDAADSSAAISITGEAHLTLTIKEVSTGVFSTLVNNVTLTSQATGFAITLDGSAHTYSLLVNEGAGTQTFTGALPGALSETGWGPNNNQGASAISFAIFDNQAPVIQGVPDSLATATVGEVTVVPEPGTWVAGALALVAVSYTQRRRFARVVLRR